jgi:hypothetical protein
MKNVISKLNINQSKIIRTLCLLIVVTMFTYIYLVNAVAFNVASRQNMVESISVLQSEISQLEMNVNEGKQLVTREMAFEMGLVKVAESERVFVLRDQTTRLTLNE